MAARRRTVRAKANGCKEAAPSSGKSALSASGVRVLHATCISLRMQRNSPSRAMSARDSALSAHHSQLRRRRTRERLSEGARKREGTS
eukprot:6212398-Pleurochrysis_carterae.AAC.1